MIKISSAIQIVYVNSCLLIVMIPDHEEIQPKARKDFVELKGRKERFQGVRQYSSAAGGHLQPCYLLGRYAAQPSCATAATPHRHSEGEENHATPMYLSICGPYI